MAVAPAVPQISEQEYLHTSYQPDMEYVDGELVERNVGNYKHGLLTGLVYKHLTNFEKTHQFRVLPDVRLRISMQPALYRIPDLMILEEQHHRQAILRQTAVSDVPLATVEIKSPDDRFDDIFEKCNEYEALGVAAVLVLDPDHRMAWIFRRGELLHIAGNSIELPGREPLPFPAGELFAGLDS